MARQKVSRTGRCQGCKHPERVQIERLLADEASIKGAARKFAIDYHAARRHWINHVSAEARAASIAGAGATKDQLEAIVADEALALLAVGTLGDPGKRSRVQPSGRGLISFTSGTKGSILVPSSGESRTGISEGPSANRPRPSASVARSP